MEFQILSNVQSKFSDLWLRYLLFKIALKSVSLDLTDDESTLLQVMTLCRRGRKYNLSQSWPRYTVYPKKYAHGFCFAVLCCGYTLTDFPISIRLTSLALWQSNDCPSASKATLMNMDKYFMWIHYERLRNHNKTKHNKTVCIFFGIYCMLPHNVIRPRLANSLGMRYLSGSSLALIITCLLSSNKLLPKATLVISLLYY